MSNNTSTKDSGDFVLAAAIKDAAAELGKAARAESEHIKAYRTSSAKRVIKQRKASLDEKIREPKKGENAIIPVELLRFERKESADRRVTYEPHPILVDEVLRSLEPTLWLGNFGQGKSTATIELTERLNANRDYVPVFLTATEINKRLHNELVGDAEKNAKKVLEILSGGVPSIPADLRKNYKFVFIIDALDEVLNYRTNVIYAVRDRDQLSKYGKVIVTSRFIGFEPYENSGFTTLHLDPQSIVTNIDKYLALRILDDAKREIFKEFLKQQDEGVRTNYLLVYFLTKIYNTRPQELGDLKGTISEGEVLIKGIEVALWDSKLPKRLDMKQEPKTYPNQPGEESEREWADYEAVRRDSLEKWMNLSQRIASYMTTHDKRTITRPEIEQIVSNKWTLTKYMSELKGR